MSGGSPESRSPTITVSSKSTWNAEPSSGATSRGSSAAVAVFRRHDPVQSLRCLPRRTRHAARQYRMRVAAGDHQGDGLQQVA